MSLPANSRLCLLCKASKHLSTAGCMTTYCALLRPLLEYTILAWMGAATTYLHQLDHVQRRAVAHHRPRCDFPMPCITPTGCCSQLPLKLLGMSATDKLTTMVPALQSPLGQSRTRSNHCVVARYAFQLSEQLFFAAPSFLSRAFPHCKVHIWSTLLPSIFSHSPCLNGLQSFNESAHSRTVDD